VPGPSTRPDPARCPANPRAPAAWRAEPPAASTWRAEPPAKSTGLELTGPVRLNRPDQYHFRNFARSGSFQPRFGPFKSHWNQHSKGKSVAKYSGPNVHQNVWERGESSRQPRRDKNRRFVRPFWLSPKQHKEVAFTVPNPLQSEISSQRRLRGPNPLRIVRTVEQSPWDLWPMDNNRHTFARRGEQVSPPNPNLAYNRACMNKYQAHLTYPDN
jgi:hypothetical protein